MAAPADDATPLSGLTSEEVAQREAHGLTNVDGTPKTKSIGQIVADHVLTLFNIVNILLAVLVFFTGSYRNMLFMVVVGANVVIGIVQEIRSKMVVDKLTVLAKRPVRVRRDGRTVEIAATDIVLGDIVLLSHGDQVPADLRVVEGECAMNESLLTGESRPVRKHPGDTLLSGSFVAEGSVAGQAVQVGEASFAARISSEAKQAKPVRSQIMATLKTIIKIATWVMIPIGVGLFVRAYFDGSTLEDAILTTVAAVVGMIPQGLVLLTSSVLAIATLRLARQKVLVQQLYCIETLARVDTLCLDKTGTITTGKMHLDSLRPVSGHAEKDVALAAAAVVSAQASDANETAEAVLAYAREHELAAPAAARCVPFSSDRKYSGCVMPDGTAYVMGAPQFVVGAPAPADLGFDALARVLVVGTCAGFDGENRIAGTVEPVGYLAIQDHVRATAPETLAYFARQGVEIKVISGDDPKTVSAIAAQAGVAHAEKYVDAATLKTQADIISAVKTYTVFGRVTPQQKKELVVALQKLDHTVAMTGDGVNDVLALREADCSIAMASGSDAARNVSEIVLVDNDFAHLPAVVAEGRQSINNLQRSAALFLEKTVFSMIIGVICVIAPPYPFLPIQMTLISSYLIGIPSFVLALEPNHERVKGGFLENVLKRSLPASAAVCLALAALIVFREFTHFSTYQISTIATCLVCVIGLALIWRISQPLNLLRGALFFSMVACVAVCIFFFQSFFQIAPFNLPMFIFFVIVGSASLAVFNILYNKGEQRDSFTGRVARWLQRLEERSYGKRSL
jgi:cation-transporting ATPase E